MSHIIIIISKAAPPTATAEEAAAAVTYDYQMPVPHTATPQQVGEMVRKAYRKLEGADAED